MGYSGGRLKDFFTAGGRAANDRLCRNVADAAGAYMTKQAIDRTPVKTGRAAATIHQKPVRRRGTVYESGAESDDLVVKFLEDGTVPHVIERRAPEPATLAFPGPGGMVYARRVNHPGTKALHMFAIAAAQTQVRLPRLARPELEKWKREVEASVTQRGKA